MNPMGVPELVHATRQNLSSALWHPSPTPAAETYNIPAKPAPHRTQQQEATTAQGAQDWA